MFQKDFDKFKGIVESTIKSFFNITPEEAIKEEYSLKNWYKSKYDFDVCDFKSIPPEVRVDLCKYKTLKYFNSIYEKLCELEEVLGGMNDTGRISDN